MHALGASAGTAAARVVRHVGPLSSEAVIKALRVSTNSLHLGCGHEGPHAMLRSGVHGQTRGLSMEVDRLQHHIRVTEDMKLSDAVRRVLAIENADRPQQKQLARQLAIEHWQRHVSDTGSPACQIATLTIRIDALHKHLTQQHRQDHSNKRGYVMLLNRRRKMLMYLKRTDFDTYRKIYQELGLSEEK